MPLVGQGAHGRRRVPADEEQSGLGNSGQDLRPDLAAQPNGGIDVGGPSHGGHECHGGIGCVRQHGRRLPAVRTDQHGAGARRQSRLFLVAHHQDMIEATDRPPLHSPEGDGLRAEQQGGEAAPGPGIAVHQGRLDVVEVEDRLLRRETLHEGHHLLIFDLQQVDSTFVGSTANGLDHRGAPEPPRRDTTCRQGPPGGARRCQPPGDGADVNSQLTETGPVCAAVVIAAQHEIAQFRQPAGDGQGALFSPVVVRQRKELRDHEHPHDDAPTPAGPAASGVQPRVSAATVLRHRCPARKSEVTEPEVLTGVPPGRRAIHRSTVDHMVDRSPRT